MSPHVINCRKCNRVFQQRSAELCPNCQKREDELQLLISEALHESAASGGMSTQELSAKLAISTEDIEHIYLEGRLGSASCFLKFPCQTCQTLTTESQRKGRFCLICSEVTAQQAGVTVKSIYEIREEEKRRLKGEQAQKATIKLTPPLAACSESQGTPKQFGFTVRSSSPSQP